MSNDPFYQQSQMAAQQQMMMDQVMMQRDMQLRGFRAAVLERNLNYAAKELNLFGERERAVTESLIVGGGLMLTEIVKMPGSNQKLVGSRFVEMENIVFDPDATSLKECKWLAIQCRHPAWLFARLYGVPEEDLKPTHQSTVSDRFHESLLRTAQPQNVTGKAVPDEVVYWKFWSRMGCGARLKPQAQREPVMDMIDEALGDFCFFIVTDALEYPANFGPQVFAQANQVQQATQMAALLGQQSQTNPVDMLRAAAKWPIEFWREVDDPWPVSMYEYHYRPGSPYPIPHLQFALSYMKFLVWVIGFIADKAYRSNRDIWLLDEAVAAQLREAIENGQDEAIVSLKGVDEKTLEQFVKILEAPGIKKELLDVYEFFNKKFQTITGLNDILQAQMERATRSATESSILDDASKLRPNSMATKVKHVDRRIARKEAIAMLLTLEMADVAPIIGPAAARAWDMARQMPIDQILRETEFDVESNQGRAQDLQTRADQSNQMAQFILPLLIQVGQATGNFAPANGLLAEWAKSRQIDPNMVQIPNMPPPAAPPPGGAGGGGQPGRQAA